MLRCMHCKHEEIVAWDLVRHVRRDHEGSISMEDIGAEHLHTTEVMFRKLHACVYCHFKNHIRDVVNAHQVLCELESGVNRRQEGRESLQGDGESEVYGEAQSFASDDRRLSPQPGHWEPFIDEFNFIDFNVLLYGDVVGTKSTSIERRMRVYLERDVPPGSYVAKKSIDEPTVMKLTVVFHPQEPTRYSFPTRLGRRNPKNYKYMATMLNVKTRPAMVAKVFYINDVAEGYFLLYQKDRLVRAARICVSQDHVFNELDVCIAFVHSLSFCLPSVPCFHRHNFCHVVVRSVFLSFLISVDVNNFCVNSSAISVFHRGNA